MRATDDGSPAADARPTQSRWFEAFLAELPQRVPPLATDLPELDLLLEGGLRPGLWIAGAESPFLGTALLDRFAWAAVDTRQNVVAYSLRTGLQATWERLLVALAARTEVPLDIADLRSASVSAECVELVRGLDETLVDRVLPYLTLSETLPGETRSLVGFLTHVEAQLLSSSPPRLVLVDALPQLAVLLGLSSGRSVALLSELDGLLRRHGAVGALAADPGVGGDLVAAVSGVLRLISATADSSSESFGPPPSEVRVELTASRWGRGSGTTAVTVSLPSI